MELWIVRNFTGTLHAYTVEPIYDNIIRDWIYDYDKETLFILDHRLFPEITYENSPQKVKIELIKE